MDVILVPFLLVLHAVLYYYTWFVIIGGILGQLVHFGVVNGYSPLVRLVLEVVSRLTNPLLVLVRSIIPPARGLDFSPLVLILLLYFAQGVIGRLLLRLL